MLHAQHDRTCYFSMQTTRVLKSIHMHALIWRLLLLMSLTVITWLCFFLLYYYSGEACEPAYRKQEAETLSPSDHRSENPSTSHRTNHFLVGVFLLLSLLMSTYSKRPKFDFRVFSFPFRLTCNTWCLLLPTLKVILFSL